MTRATLVLDGSPVEPGSVGGKGLALNRLIAMGAPVPPTGSITTFGYRWFVRESGMQRFIDDLRGEGLPDQADLDVVAERVDEAFLEAAMPDALAAQIRDLAASVGDGALLAVRSSATAEDMAAASFAGQYRSYLEVDEEGLLRAVKLVWASLWLPAPRSYRAHAQIPEDDLAMSVVVMRLVDARRAGVVFTVDPTGQGSDLRIEAVEGLADRLVSGAVTPEAHVIPRAAVPRLSVDPVLDEAIEAALSLEDRFGGPQDVEWAHDGERLYVVQTRPITTVSAIGSDDGFDTRIGPEESFTTAGIGEALPGVLPPLQWTTAGPLLENGFRHLFDRMKALPLVADRRPFLARIRGRAVLSLDLMRAAAAEVPGGSAEEIERQYFGRVITESVKPRQETRARGPLKGLRAMFTGFREINVRRSFRFESEASIEATERLLDSRSDCDLMSSGQLLAYRHRLLDLAGRLIAAEIAVAAAGAAAYRGVELFLEAHFGDEAPGLVQQLTAGGIDPCGAEIALRTCALAESALRDDDLARSIGGLSPRDAALPANLSASSKGTQFLTEFEGQLGRSGSASVFSGETWAESRELAWQLVSQAIQVARSGRPPTVDPGARLVLLEEVGSRLAASWKWRMQRVMTAQIIDVRRRLLRRLVADAVEFLYLRQKTKSAVLALGGEVRRAHLALGNHLQRAGKLETPQDIDLLAAEELEHALNGSRWPSAWEVDRRRNVLHRLQEDDSMPQVFVGDPSRHLAQAAVPSGDAFPGWAASPGVYEGPARVIAKATEPIEPGDVLVARTTDPAWTPLFLTAGAIVVEEGGPLSHAAIIARELGLPAVLNVPGLLGRLAPLESARLRVDGNDGQVVVLDAEGAAEPAKVVEVAG